MISMLSLKSKKRSNRTNVEASTRTFQKKEKVWRKKDFLFQKFDQSDGQLETEIKYFVWKEKQFPGLKGGILKELNQESGLTREMSIVIVTAVVVGSY